MLALKTHYKLPKEMYMEYDYPSQLGRYYYEVFGPATDFNTDTLDRDYFHDQGINFWHEFTQMDLNEQEPMNTTIYNKLEHFCLRLPIESFNTIRTVMEDNPPHITS